MHLIDDRLREHACVRDLAKLSVLMHQKFWASLNVAFPMTWIAHHVQASTLVPGVDGEIDLIAGPMEISDHQLVEQSLSRARRELPGAHPEVANSLAIQLAIEAGGLEWPPRLERIVAIEAKCSRLVRASEAPEPEDYKARISRQKQADVKKQIDRCYSFGVDAVMFVDFLVTPPQEGSGSDPWLAAAAVSNAGHRHADFTSTRLEGDETTGHWLIAIGAVSHKPEDQAGACAGSCLRQMLPSSRRHDLDVMKRREIMVDRLRGVLAQHPPRSNPHIVDAGMPA